jgi:hypothetical protein
MYRNTVCSTVAKKHLCEKYPSACSGFVPVSAVTLYAVMDIESNE